MPIQIVRDRRWHGHPVGHAPENPCQRFFDTKRPVLDLVAIGQYVKRRLMPFGMAVKLHERGIEYRDNPEVVAEPGQTRRVATAENKD